MTKVEKAMNQLSSDDVRDLEALSSEALSAKIADASEAMRQVTQELEDNGAYQELKANKTAMEVGKKEVNKRQKAIIEVCLHLRKEKGIT